MFYQTLDHLRCPAATPACGGRFNMIEPACFADSTDDVEWGFLECEPGDHRFPILGGVALLVEDVDEYVRMHAHGIRATVDWPRMPEHLAHIEPASEYRDWALESEELNRLYLASHYLTGEQVAKLGRFHPAFETLIRSHWDGPAEYLNRAFGQMSEPVAALLDMGCSVGGAVARARPLSRFCLGIDHGFRAIFTARLLNCRPAAHKFLEFRPDLLSQPRRVPLGIPRSSDNLADFVIGDLLHPPVAMNHWDVALSLNVMDVLPEPGKLPEVQAKLLKQGGTVTHSCPYQWTPDLAAHLRSQLPPHVRDSAQAEEWLYQQHGFQINDSLQHLPWLFFEHERRLDLYSAHMLTAKLARPEA